MTDHATKPRWLLGLLGSLLLGLAEPATAAEADSGKLEYNRDVRPILNENCFACHGPDSAARKADLRLDLREIAVEMGAIEPGDPDASELVARIDEADKTLVMPPPSTTKKLTAEQKAILRRWVEQGAEYQPHWSFLAPKRAEPPAVKDEARVRNPIDRFVLAKLEQAGLSPAPEADRRTLARRLSLDLTGLPPSPEVVERFVNDKDPKAYEHFIDRLMATPAWGEHRARTWLDAARYADTHGIHFDNYREMWSYRQWVIDAFNKNMPFDRFTIEQLAGDLLPDRTLDQQIASGFNRCNMTTNEGGTIPEEYLVLYTRDRTETTSQVWLGLTTGCAVCHDHKFDPLTQREFYEMAAFFNNNAQNAMDGNIKDTPPTTFVPSAEDRVRWAALSASLTAAKQQLDDRKAAAKPEFDAWFSRLTPARIAGLIPADDATLATNPSGEARPSASTPGSYENQAAGDFEKDAPFSVAAWVRVNKANQTGAILARMDNKADFRGWDLWLEGGKVGTHIVHKWPDDALKVVANTPLKPNEWTHVLLTYDGSGKAAGVKIYLNGNVQPVTVGADKLTATIRTGVPLKVAQRHDSDKLKGVAVGDLRLYAKALAPDQAAQLTASTRTKELLSRPADSRSAAEIDGVFAWWLGAFDDAWKADRVKLSALEADEAAIKARGTVAHVMQEKPDEAMAFVLFRGDYDKRRDPVTPDTPDILPPLPPDQPRNRLGFARWLLSPEHPLTARVTVNRFWQEVFGTGLVRTSGDFGVTGELPSHPELLDWLAIDFRESGWDVQRLFKLMVTSATYRQAAVATPAKLEKDAANRLLSRGPRYRMDAEMVRDYALAASGLLVSKIGGPSVRPYQPEGVWEAVAMPESNTKSYRPDQGESLYRRSLYTFWKRAAPPASMEIFNAPNRETCSVRRERTNTPLQALVTLNDPQFVEAARHLAERLLQEDKASADDRLDRLARLVLARPFRPEEASIVRRSLDGLLAHYAGHAEEAADLIRVGESTPDLALDPARLAAWTMLANELLNLDEVLNK